MSTNDDTLLDEEFEEKDDELEGFGLTDEEDAGTGEENFSSYNSDEE